MTTEQAIKLLHRLQDEQFDGQHGDERREALEMAIRAIEELKTAGSGSVDSEQPEIKTDRTTDDTISRQDAIDALKYMCPEDEGGITVSRANVDSMLRKLPSVQPERKKGKWIILPPIFEEICQCSNCKMKFKDALQWTNYCPNCGADMRGGENG